MSFAEFFARARIEAARYGPDQWIFVRELLQNARDAGATRVDFELSFEDGYTTLRCRDDGEGMSFTHARDYLFSLYSSSKESDGESVGRFGVGFWSVLRFEPDSITIRSRPRSAAAATDLEAWEIRLLADAPVAERRRPEMQPGTELLLQRAGHDPEAARRLVDAARQNARYLCRRNSDVPLEVIVDGQRINAPFELPAPRARFEVDGARGVVALGDRPRVELFSKGLRVRAASCLEDLLSAERASGLTRVSFPSVEGTMAPQVLLESPNLEPLLSRDDARDDPHMRRVVGRAQRELRRLVRRQLDSLRPPGIRERLAELGRRVGEAPVVLQVAGATLVGATLAVFIAPLVWPAPPAGTLEGPTAPRSLTSYRDLGSSYLGPQVSELDATQAQRVDLAYAPADAELDFSLLVVDALDTQASQLAELTTEPYRGRACRDAEGCAVVSLGIDVPAGPMRIPVPTGYRLDASSLRFAADPNDPDGVALGPLRRTTADEPVVDFARVSRGRIRYRVTALGPSDATDFPSTSPVLGADALALPPELAREAARLRAIEDREARVSAAVAFVRTRVTYRVDAATAEAHRVERARGRDFLERALAISAGDCDVQNGVLAALLRAANVDARLVIGVVGRGGQASPWLHAWIEWRGEDGVWRGADASEGAPAPPTAGLPRSRARDPGLDRLAANTFEGAAATGGSSPAFGDAGDPTTGSGANSEGGGFPDAASAARGMEGAAETRAASGEDVPGVAGVAGVSGVTGVAGVAGVAGRASAAEMRSSAAWVRWVRAAPEHLPHLLFALLAFIGVGLIAALWRRRRLDLELAPEADLASMLHGALRQPQAFRQLPELFTRRLVPRRRGHALSLSEARQLAARGQLYAASGSTPLGEAASKLRAAVLDLECDEGRAVAATLGATDLDEFGELDVIGERDGFLDAVEVDLVSASRRWRLRRVDRRLAGGARSVDLAALGLDRMWGADRLVFVDSGDPVFAEAKSLATEDSALARFAWLDDLCARLELRGIGRAELLEGVARSLYVDELPSGAPDDDLHLDGGLF